MSESKAILVVDDDPLMADVVADFLKMSCSHEIVVCHDGKEAFEKLGSKEFAIVISDVRMPKMDGIQLLAAIKKDYSELPVILLTGFADLSESEALALGAAALLSKPIPCEELTAIVLEKIAAT